jgi:DNA polymerase sigma
MCPVAHARVPVIKGTWKDARNPYRADGSIDFDICLLNDAAVVNSSLIREYCQIDERIRQLCKAVKEWAKGQKISSAADSTLSSYTWTNMVLIYLQSIQFCPNLQSPELAASAGVARSETNPWHCINNLDTFFLTWKQASTVWKRPESLENVSVSALLYAFFEFYDQQQQDVSPLFVLGLKRSSTTSNSVPRTVFRKMYLVLGR